MMDSRVTDTDASISKPSRQTSTEKENPKENSIWYKQNERCVIHPYSFPFRVAQHVDVQRGRIASLSKQKKSLSDRVSMKHFAANAQ